jgi:diguanylate cyclase (GGDEF)-like protein/PAS domain S-box-containing protein
MRGEMMQIARQRDDEQGSLDQLRALGVLDTAPEAQFDALVQAASLVCGTPISLISLIDVDRQWFKANVGLEGVLETPRDVAFCSHAVLDDVLLEVPDARLDPRFHDNPLVVGHPDIRFYAGMPLRLSSGESIGTLCVIDRVPRTLDDTQRSVLRMLASAATHALEQRRLANAFVESERRYRALVEDQTELVSLATPDGMLTFVNAAYAQAHGCTPEEMVGKCLLDFVPSDQQADVRAHFQNVCQSQHALHGENQMRMPLGEMRWFAWTNRAIIDTAGRITSVHSVGRDITEQKLIEKRLADKRKRLTNIVDGTHAGTWEWNVATNAAVFNEHWADILGYTLDDLAPLSFQTWLNLLHPEDIETSTALLQRHFSGESDVYECDVRMRHRDGHWVWVHTRGRVMTRLPSGEPEWMFGTHIDVTERRQMLDELAKQHELLRVTLHSIGDAVITTDADGAVTWLNPVAERMTGWLAQDAQGKPLHQVFHIVNEATRAPTENPVATCLQQGKVVGLANHTMLISRDGQEFSIEDSAAPIRNSRGDVLGVVLVFHDVTEQRRLSGEMTYRATHDALTGLLNRVEFETRLLRSLRDSHEFLSEHAVLYIDLDQFKLVNDACGHAIGDQLLQQVSKLLTDAVRARDTVARLGGDEFGLILEHCSSEQARRVAQKICDQMDEFRFIHGDRRFRIGTSIGLVSVDRRWANTAAIQQAADTACYAAKEAGRNRVHIWFDTDLAMRARSHEMQWTSRIERALDDDRFVLYGQRIQHLQGDATHIHAEVLLRMCNDDDSLIPPGAFLPAAERFHLASRIDRWVLKHTVAWLKALPSLDIIGNISVNLSGQSVGDRVFHAWANDMLTQAGSSVCAKLCLEITETAAVTNLADAAIFIQGVRAAGVKVSLDDFGAGASSFGYLKNLPVDVLKIDGQFIRNVVKDPLDEAAVRCFIEVAQLMGLKTVAEFVDNEAVLARLKTMGVDYAQGFLIHRPEPIDTLLEAHQPIRTHLAMDVSR